VLYAKESLVEACYFVFSVDTRYWTYISQCKLPQLRRTLENAITVSIVSAVKNREWSAVLLKFVLFAYPFYWAVAVLTLIFFIFHGKVMFIQRDIFFLFLFMLMFYILAISSLANRGLARYRSALHPEMMLAATYAIYYIAKYYVRNIRKN
jgi:hypothetical protein